MTTLTRKQDPTRRVVAGTVIPPTDLRDLKQFQIDAIYRTAEAKGAEFAEVYWRAHLMTGSGQILSMLRAVQR